LTDDAEETVGEAVVAILGAGDFDIAIAGEFFAHGREGVVGGVEGFVETGGEETGLQAGSAQDGLLRESHALQSEHLLGVDGLVDRDEIGLEAIDFAGIFETDDGERGGEAVRDGGLFEGRWFGGA
jgi:hypothetical protein